jgi:hypothetical protein
MIVAQMIATKVAEARYLERSDEEEEFASGARLELA